MAGLLLVPEVADGCVAWVAFSGGPVVSHFTALS